VDRHRLHDRGDRDHSADALASQSIWPKNYFVTSIVGFTLASIFCGAASDLNVLIAARVVQGAFGGGLLATGQSILRDTFPPKQLGLSQGIFALGAIMGSPALGPPLGGGFADRYGRALAACSGPRLDAVRPHRRRAALLVCRPDGFRDDADHARVAWHVRVVGVTRAVADRRSASPAKPQRRRGIGARARARRRNLWIDLHATAIHQGPLGFTPTLSGMLFIMRAGPIFIATPILVRITRKVDPRILLGLGFLLIATESYLQARITTAEATFWSFGAALAITGFGAALLFIPLSIAVLGATRPSEGPKASAFVNLATQLGGSIAVAGLDVLINQRESFHSAILGASASLSRPATAAFLQHGTLAQLARQIDVQALILSYADATLAIAVVCILCAPLIFCPRDGRK